MDLEQCFVPWVVQEIVRVAYVVLVIEILFPFSEGSSGISPIPLRKSKQG